MAVFPLRHIAGSELKKVISVMVPENRIITLEGQDRTIIATGTTDEIRAIAGVVDALDVSEMAGMSSMLVTLEASDADKVTEELKDIFGIAGGATGIRILPVQRLNGVVIMGSDEALLNHAFSWIRRLDQRLFVYRLQHRRASELATSLRELLAEGGLPSVNADTLRAVIEPIVDKDIMLVSDGHRADPPCAAARGVRHEALNLSGENACAMPFTFRRSTTDTAS